MELRKFNLGDLVCLKVHPFIEDIHNIIISGDATTLSPIMVISEILKSRHIDKITNTETFNLKYKCIWFSTKTHRFIDAWIFEADLKLFEKNIGDIDSKNLKRGDKITLKTIRAESVKKKSSLSYEDNSVSQGNSNTIINSLLSFLPPVLQVILVSKHQHKLPLVDRGGKPIRIVSEWDIKCVNFDPLANKISEVTLPSEVLQLVLEINEKILREINDVIASETYLYMIENDIKTLIKPRHIAYRNGIYYLRAYDYLENKVNEIEITTKQIYEEIKKPFAVQLPSFDIAHNPASATPKFIIKEISEAIKKSIGERKYIRIKYKNRNDILSHRSIKNYKLLRVKGFLKDDYYLKGYCCTRKSERTFRVDRIQSFQEIDIKYK